MGQRKTVSTGLFTIGIAALFLAGFFLLVIFGARIYQGTAGRQERNEESRAELAYFTTIMKAGDVAGAVELRDSEYGQVFVLRDGTGYALRVYLCEGRLLEEYEAADAPLDPERAQVIGRTETFAVTEEAGLIRVRTDAGQVLLHPRCGGEG